jgi:hypothetical protein
MAIRNPAMFPYVNEKNQPGTSLTLTEAVTRFKGAEELPSPMVSRCLCYLARFLPSRVASSKVS